MRIDISKLDFWGLAGLIDDSFFLSVMANVGDMAIERRGETVFLVVA